MQEEKFPVHPVYKDHPLDTFFVKRIQEIVKEYGITTIVETGVDRGNSTVFFAQTVEKVYGIEILQESIDFATKRLQDHDLKNVELIQGNSSVVLLGLMSRLDVDKTLFFLDAHWQAYWPLRDEIDAISRNKGIIVVHDAKVPNRPDFGYDTWNGNELSYEFIEGGLTNWSKTHKVEYSTEHYHPNPRGVMYIFPN